MTISAKELEMAIFCSRIINTKWHQFRKRAKLHREAKTFSKENGFEY